MGRLQVISKRPRSGSSSVASLVPGIGVQSVTGTLDVSGGLYMVYDPSIFDKNAYPAATYTVFTYGTLNLGSYPTFGAAVTNDFTTTGYTSAVYSVDTSAKTVTVTLS